VKDLQVKFTPADGKLAGQEVAGRQYGDFAVVKIIAKKTAEYPWSSERAYLYYVPSGEQLRRTDGPTDTQRLYAIAEALEYVTSPLPDDFVPFLAACIKATQGSPAQGRWDQSKWEMPSYNVWHERWEYGKKYDLSLLTEPGTPLDWSVSGHFRLTPEGRTLCNHGLPADIAKGPTAALVLSDDKNHCPTCERVKEGCTSRAWLPVISTREKEIAFLRTHKKRLPVTYFPPQNRGQRRGGRSRLTAAELAERVKLCTG
jgi:hypothetical protein